MLAAVLNGKRRGSGFAGRELFLENSNGSEDVLTATVFERLAYLPDSIFAAFIYELLALDQPIGVVEEIIFWPSWSFSGQRVEPDVIFRGSQRTLLIEAKRHDDRIQQNASQLAKELQAGWEEDVLGENPLLLTVGGMLDHAGVFVSDLHDQVSAALGPSVPDFDFYCRGWLEIFQALKSAIEISEEKDGGLYRLLSDVAEAYEWHGLRTMPYRRLGEIKAVQINNVRFPLNLPNSLSVEMNSIQPDNPISSNYLSSLKPVNILYVRIPIIKWILP